jgi:release factor glutamine methyltransferase
MSTVRAALRPGSGQASAAKENREFAPEGAYRGAARALTTLLAQGAARLATALGLTSREARLEVQVLAAHGLGVDRAWLIAHDRDVLQPAQIGAIERLFRRREAGEPVAYIVGGKEFYGRMFRVTPDVLIPRPETEHLVEAALERLSVDQPSRILDLGTGSGCVAVSLALERPLAKVVAVDVSAAALAIARENARLLGAGSIRFILGEWYAGVGVKKFDMIVANPPYIPDRDRHLACGDLRFEPRNALVSTADGLDAIRAIIEGATDYLHVGGWLLLEHGHDQQSRCESVLAQNGFGAIMTVVDLVGIPRVCGGCLSDGTNKTLVV